MKFLLWLFWGLLLIALFVVWVRYIERHSIYFPMKEMSVTPREIGLVYEEIYFETSDNKKLHSWFIPSDKKETTLSQKATPGRAQMFDFLAQDSVPRLNPERREATAVGPWSFTILFCHGNAGNISHRLEKIMIFHNLGLNVFIFDYRGYGKSEGMPSETGLYKDADAAYKYLTEKRKISKDNIVLYGESLGGAVSINLAEKESLKALITEEAFTSTKDMARIYYPFVPHFLMESRLDSLSKIKDVACPKLIIHSVDDEIVPFRLGERLFGAANAPKKFLKIRGSHNTAFLDSEKEFREGIKSFLGDL